MKTRAAVLHRTGAEPPYRGTDVLTVEQLELDEPRAGELVVRVEAAGLCHSDLSVINGARPRPVPMVLGHEAAGVVERVGAGVADVAEGDHVVLTFMPSCGLCPECTGGRPALCRAGVAANGEGRLLGGGRRFRFQGADVHHHLGVSAFAERTIVARGSAVVVPRDVPLEVAALLGCAALTGYGAAVTAAGLRPGQSVAVFGLGGVGLSAVMGAAAAGAYPVIAVDVLETKLALAKEIGADVVADADSAEASIRAAVPGGVDIAIECVGSAAAMEAAFRSTARGGRTICVGLPRPDVQLQLAALDFAGQGKSLEGSYMGWSVPQRDVPRMIRLWQAGDLPLERLHSGNLGFDTLAGGFDALARGEVVRQLLRPHGLT